MDLNFDGYHGFFNGCEVDDPYIISDAKEFQNLENDWEFEENLVNFTIDPFYRADADPVSFAPQTWVTSDVDEFIPSWTVSPAEVELDLPFSTIASAADSSPERNGFLETVQCINQILMEENLDQKPSMYYDPLSLKFTEKSFYDALKENHTSSPNQHPLDIYENVERPDVNGSESSDSNVNSNVPWHRKPHNPKPSSLGTAISDDYSFKSNLQSISPKPSQPPDASLANIDDGVMGIGSFSNEFLAQKIFNNAESVLQFQRGLEEASKFLPKGTQLTTGLERNMSLELKKKMEEEVIKADEDIRQDSHRIKGRKNLDREDVDTEEERSNKQSALYVDESDESDLADMFDQVLLSIENVPLCAQQEGQQNGSIKVMQPTEQPNSSDRGKTRSKKKGKKKETVDLRTLLVLCAQAVSSNDNRTANELLKQIKRYSSPFGDGAQRLAHYFATGLEARLVGPATGTQWLYASLMKRFSAAQVLRVYQALFSVCPFKKFAHFFTYKMILEAAEKAESLHIIDFGISYGFHWPMLIKFLSERNGGPPKLRITGIEYPQTGFRPAERIEETGHRLANYCKRFNVPFEYKAIASKNWETIKLEEFNIESKDLLAVNCLMRFKNLLDDTIEVNNPRNAVLSLIRKMNPDIFVQSVVNGAYNAPFFVTRFRESLFHFSAMYDMFDTLLPRENEWRMMSEKEFLGREALNVIACEGSERVERPETYKQWQVRNTRIGFKQLPLTKELMSKFQEKLKAWYHRDFVMDEDNNWILQGWKGRILYASTCWVPA